MVAAGDQRNDFYQVMLLKKGYIDIDVNNGYKKSSIGIYFLPFINVLLLFIE